MQADSTPGAQPCQSCRSRDVLFSTVSQDQVFPELWLANDLHISLHCRSPRHRVVSEAPGRSHCNTLFFPNGTVSHGADIIMINLPHSELNWTSILNLLRSWQLVMHQVHSNLPTITSSTRTGEGRSKSRANDLLHRPRLRLIEIWIFHLPLIIPSRWTCNLEEVRGSFKS